jgi:hypothetical protein
MTCTIVLSKKYQRRPSPPYHAGDCKGTVKKGKDGTYVSKADTRGVYKWVKVTVKTGKGTAKATMRTNKTKKINRKNTIDTQSVSTEDIKQMGKKYKVSTHGSKQEMAEGLWRVRRSVIQTNDLNKLFSLLSRASKKEVEKLLKERETPIVNYKGMWKPMPKPLGSMTHNELIKHLQEFRNAWEKITTRNADLSDERLHSETDKELRNLLTFYYSDASKMIAEDWLRK